MRTKSVLYHIATLSIALAYGRVVYVSQVDPIGPVNHVPPVDWLGVMGETCCALLIVEGVALSLHAAWTRRAAQWRWGRTYMALTSLYALSYFVINACAILASWWAGGYSAYSGSIIDAIRLEVPLSWSQNWPSIASLVIPSLAVERFAVAQAGPKVAVRRDMTELIGRVLASSVVLLAVFHEAARPGLR
jgi:hypothetical protein